MDKPKNPYQINTIIHDLMDGDWGDLTPVEIADVLGTTADTIRVYIRKIKNETGYCVPHTDGRKRRFETIE